MFVNEILNNQKTNRQIKEIDNADKILSYLETNKWSLLTIKAKKYLIYKICKMEANEYNIKKIPQLQYFTKYGNTGGFYRLSEDTIFLNESILYNENGYESYGILTHELTHVKQSENLSDIIYNMYFKNPMNKINFCNFIDKIGYFSC